MKKIPEWATHYVEMMDGGKFFVECNDCMSKPPQFECISDFGGQNPWSDLKSLVIGIDEYKSNLKEEDEYQWLFDAPKSKTVRPVMTVEARDALNKFHESTGFDSRSESIVAIGMLNKDRNTLQSEVEAAEAKLRNVINTYREKLSNQNKRAHKYKIISTITSAAFFALLAVTIFNAS